MLWSISNERNAVVIHTNPVPSPTTAHQPSLIFWHSGDEYTLAQFWITPHYGQELKLGAKVTITMLAKSGEYVEIGAEQTDAV